MPPRTLWTILLKIIGIYIFLQVLYTLPQILMLIASLTQSNINGTWQNSFTLEQIAAMFFSTGIYLFMVIAFLFRPDWLINALRLNRGISEEKLELNMHRSTVLQIAIIIAGLLILVDSLPSLLKDLFDYYQQINVFNGFKRYPSGGLIILGLLKVLISFFMVTSSRLIVNYIERKRRGPVNIKDT